MNWRLVARLLGLLSLLIACCMLLSLPWSWPELGQTAVFESGALKGMLLAIGISTLFGIVLIVSGRNSSGSVLRKEALAVVGLGWLLCGFLGSLPYVLSPTYRLAGVPMSLTDAMFESISGFSTTGASVLTQLEVPAEIDDCELAAKNGIIAYVPRSVLFWRSLTHWLGGMGIIVLFVALLGQLGVGGKALMRREVPGPVADTLRPRVRETAMIMWTIYLVLSGILALVLLYQGMSVFEALCHTFGTLATGGFSTRNGSVGAFDSAGIELTLIVFMLAAGVNFNLYYVFLRQPSGSDRIGIPQRLMVITRDPEFRVYLGIIVVSATTLSVVLLNSGTYELASAASRHAWFNIAAVITTTGFGTEDYAVWPWFGQAWLLILMFVGACSGSTGGGVKVIRCIVLFKVLLLEAERAFRPNLIRPVRLSGQRMADSVGKDVLIYMCLIAAIFAGSWMALVGLESFSPRSLEQWNESGQTSASILTDCAGAVAATLNNIGPGLGVCGPHGNYTHFSDPGKILLTLLMLLGRLELFAVIVLFVPGFWRLH
ncbi:MAG: TrkH family potassium uptake protein [Fuerstiella sp.]|nr:TrkH family potassium uptake protein [Fuerstiella sp.]